MGIEQRKAWSTYAAMTASLGGLPSSTAGVGRQTALIDNSTTKYVGALVNLAIKLGTSPTANKSVYIYLLQGNGTNRTDGASASAGALTVRNAALVGIMTTGTAPGTGDVLRKTISIEDLGAEWGLVIVHDSAVNLDATDGNHVITWSGYKWETASI